MPVGALFALGLLGMGLAARERAEELKGLAK